MAVRFFGLNYFKMVQEIIKSNIGKKEFLEISRRGMREAVISGSARFLGDLIVNAAGKTGTAETAKNRSPHVWFTVFAPYENPEIVIDTENLTIGECVAKVINYLAEKGVINHNVTEF